jgi:hypothetical protein
MANLTYGTPEFYKEQFMDFLADAQNEEPHYGDAIVEGFILAIQDWRDYHAKQVDEYNRIEQRVRQALTV